MPENLLELQEALGLLRERGHVIGQTFHNKEGMVYVEIDRKALPALDVIRLSQEPPSAGRTEKHSS